MPRRHRKCDQQAKKQQEGAGEAPVHAPIFPASRNGAQLVGIAFRPPTIDERRIAGEAARALRAAIADPLTAGTGSSAHIDFSRPRRGEWWTTWANLPGFVRVNSLYRHACLPGWTYKRSEIVAEMIPDLEALAERGVRPTEATSTAGAA